MAERTDTTSTNEELFFHLVLMFQMAAMQQIGKIPNPLTQKIERDLEQAKYSIDVLVMLQHRTKGNLTDQENEFMKKTLFELQMNYVDEVNRSEKEGKEPEIRSKETPPGEDTDDEASTEKAPAGGSDLDAPGSEKRGKKKTASTKKKSKPDKSR